VEIVTYSAFEMAKTILVDPYKGNVTWTMESDNNLTMIIIYDVFVKDKIGGEPRQEWVNQDTYHGMGSHEINKMSAAELIDGGWMAFVARAIDPSDAGGNHVAAIKFYQEGQHIGQDNLFDLKIPAGSGPYAKFGDVYKFQKKV
jgi:hypothetical protein